MLEVLAAAAMALEISRLHAPEASQGVAVDAAYIYAIGNSTIAKYDRKSGRRVAAWSGDPEHFPHLNSCALIGREMLCASSNYPATPMQSTVEVFDPVKLAHRRSIRLGHQVGSLTWIDRKDGSWWACFANYDGRGGEPGRDHRFTTLVRFDDEWRAHESWTFPPEVLDRFAPRSASGGAWGANGRLYVTGHDRPEVYVLDVPKGAGVLKLVATITVPVEGQAIAFDRSARNTLFGISRARRDVVGMKLPPVEVK